MIRLVCLSALVLGAVSAAALGQTGNFTVSQNGKAVGTASFGIVSKANDGFDSASTVKVSMQGLTYALSKTEVLSASKSLVHVQLSAIVNGSAVNIVTKPDGAQLLMNISANGRSSTSRLAGHAQAVFLPDFDAGALQILLDLGEKSNNRDLWAIVPKQAGSIEPVRLATYPDEQGTLNGARIAVHHLVATIAGADTDLFTGPENQLLQAELPQGGFALVRNGFVMKPPTKAPAPPPAPVHSPSQPPTNTPGSANSPA